MAANLHAKGWIPPPNPAPIRVNLIKTFALYKALKHSQFISILQIYLINIKIEYIYNVCIDYDN